MSLTKEVVKGKLMLHFSLIYLPTVSFTTCSLTCTCLMYFKMSFKMILGQKETDLSCWSVVGGE